MRFGFDNAAAAGGWNLDNVFVFDAAGCALDFGVLGALPRTAVRISRIGERLSVIQGRLRPSSFRNTRELPAASGPRIRVM